MAENKHTATPWMADLRNGCCAIYPKVLEGETNGCHSYDERNIFYSAKGAKPDEKQGWIMDEETQANAERIVHCVNHFDELVEALKAAVPCVNHSGLKTTNEKVKQALKNAQQ